MIHLYQARDALAAFIDLGGWVVALIIALSVLSGAVVLWKLAQFYTAGVGRHAPLLAALAASDAGQQARALALAEAAPSHLAPVLALALQARDARDRLYTLAEARLARLEAGFRLLDGVAQTAPLLGLFGTVLGMIAAFRAMQDAGQSVDPSVLAGGIWVALMTTAAGLAVAMPLSAILSWLEGRMAHERRMAEALIEGALRPGLAHG
ncbi:MULTISPECIES: MotA/TolQ/ExbB proton channel family protein [Yoonia]|jgi:biopolymer transport protein ExbB|uniref:MotA/TolQ/ExbB proton channel family protein n=1 Tax=Yoonia vestfoldensis SKA53 TaxID=314232 RepID=A3V7R4_9RHOB|nr:MotA/TolQ/ExbB proton channel family protein [Yoonia vestfoldensis]EAQ05714.1 MotA/TolQ/ExbB proton channel family protein [Yoonia vestfoldensis SKA53]